jgi:Fic family protein
LPSSWVKLGECQSKCEHIAGVPLRPATAQYLHSLYLAKGCLATTAIEGNTLSEKEVMDHLEGKLKLPPSREYLAQEVDNIVLACNRLLEGIQQGRTPGICVETLKEMNRSVLKKLKLSEEVEPGQIRRHRVTVARYLGAPPEDCDYLLSCLCSWLNGDEFAARPGMAIVYAIVKAVLAHLYLAWIHPFGDGNGRTARLAEFQILIQSGVPAPAAHLLSNHYNRTRTEYYRLLDETSRSGGDVLPFLEYAVQGLLDGLREQLEVIRDQQWDVTWRNHVHEMFRDKASPSDVRRRHLALDLSQQPEEVPFDRLRLLTPRIAKAYSGKTSKTLSRDLKMLIDIGLVEKRASGYRAKKEVILSFLPVKVGG